MILSNCVLRFGGVKLEHLWLWTKHTRLHPCSPLLYMDSLHLNTKVSSTALWRNSALEPGRQHQLCSPTTLTACAGCSNIRQVVAPMGSSCLRAGQPALLILPHSLSALQYCTSGLDLQSRPPSELSCLQRHSNGQKCLPVLHSEVNLAKQVVIM